MKIIAIVNGQETIGADFGYAYRDDLLAMRAYLEHSYKLGMALGIDLSVGVKKSTPMFLSALKGVVTPIARHLPGIKHHINGAKALPSWNKPVAIRGEGISQFLGFMEKGTAAFNAGKESVENAIDSSTTLDDLTEVEFGFRAETVHLQIRLSDDENDVVGLGWFRRHMLKLKTGIEISYAAEEWEDHVYSVEVPAHVLKAYMLVLAEIPKMDGMFRIFAAFDKEHQAYIGNTEKSINAGAAFLDELLGATAESKADRERESQALLDEVMKAFE
jgi:hypothetical protein